MARLPLCLSLCPSVLPFIVHLEPWNPARPGALPSHLRDGPVLGGSREILRPQTASTVHRRVCAAREPSVPPSSPQPPQKPSLTTELVPWQHPEESSGCSLRPSHRLRGAGGGGWQTAAQLHYKSHGARWRRRVKGQQAPGVPAWTPAPCTMAPSPLSWLFRLTALCHLTMLLEGEWGAEGVSYGGEPQSPVWVRPRVVAALEGGG